MSWYLRSGRDDDTHRGELRLDGTVAAECGTTFTPRELAYGAITFIDDPPDPDQVCPGCKLVQVAR
ncbi:MAG: hypothetical protein ACRDQY_26640 [Pseudonocardiaceae bacterium]